MPSVTVCQSLTLCVNDVEVSAVELAAICVMISLFNRKLSPPKAAEKCVIFYVISCNPVQTA